MFFLAKEVETRMKSIRTQFGRLTKPEPSGSAAKEITPKQAWLKKNCSFLGPHLKKKPSQSNLKPVRFYLFSKQLTKP